MSKENCNSGVERQDGAELALRSAGNPESEQTPQEIRTKQQEHQEQAGRQPWSRDKKAWRRVWERGLRNQREARRIMGQKPGSQSESQTKLHTV